MSDHICDQCGEPLDDQEEFNARADMISEALEGAGLSDEMDILIFFLSRWLSGIHAEDRKRARRDAIKMLDEMTRTWVIGNCDA